MTEKKEEIPLFPMLNALDKGDKSFYSNLSPAQQKGFTPWLAMRWLSSAEGRNAEHYLLMTNDLVNDEFTSLSKHPELQWKIMSLCGVGTVQKHAWIAPGKKKGKNKVQAALSKLFPRLKSDELEVMEKIYTPADLRSLFKDAGYPDDEIKEIL